MLTFKSKTESITVEETFGLFTLLYRFNLVDGVLSGQMSGEARKEGVQQTSALPMNTGGTFVYQSTSDGVNFSGSVNSTVTDYTTGLVEKMKADMVILFDNMENYLGN